MINLVMLGSLKSSIGKNSLKKLISHIKDSDPEGSFFFVADISAAFTAQYINLAEQAETAFNSGIDLLLASEGAILTARGRNFLKNPPGPILLPANLEATLSYQSSKTFEIEKQKLTFVTVTGGSQKFPVFYPHFFLDDFLEKSNPSETIILNLFNSSHNYMEAIRHRYKSQVSAIFGWGEGYATILRQNENFPFIQHDAGTIAEQKTIGGENFEAWWKYNIEKNRISVSNSNSLLSCDFTQLKLNEKNKIIFAEQNTVLF